MKTLGVSMIVKNEAEGIRECLESIKDADEIVILDTGSQDDTVSICREYTDKVFTDYEWQDSFCEARNVCMNRCRADYILIIDADERLVTPIGQLKKMVNEFWFKKYFGAFMNVHTITNDEFMSAPRLFKNVDQIYYINEAHNEPTWNGQSCELQKRLYKTDFLIEGTYSSAHSKDPERTLRILKKMYDKNPDNTRTIHYLAIEYMNHGDIRQAVELWEKNRRLKLECETPVLDNEISDDMFWLAQAYADKQLWGRVRWFDAVTAAIWSICILPTQKNVMAFLSVMFSEIPYGLDKNQAIVDGIVFWWNNSIDATNKNVAIQRGNQINVDWGELRDMNNNPMFTVLPNGKLRINAVC